MFCRFTHQPPSRINDKLHLNHISKTSIHQVVVEVSDEVRFFRYVAFHPRQTSPKPYLNSQLFATITTSTSTHIANQWICHSRGWLIGLISSWHYIAIAHAAASPFSLCLTRILKWCFTFGRSPSWTLIFPCMTVQLFSMNFPLFSASITPSLRFEMNWDLWVQYIVSFTATGPDRTSRTNYGFDTMDFQIP